MVTTTSPGGTLTNTGNDLGVGMGNSSTGVMDVSGGSVSTGSWIVVGRGSGTSSGLLNVTGGSVTSTSNKIALNRAATTGAISIPQCRRWRRRCQCHRGSELKFRNGYVDFGARLARQAWLTCSTMAR